MEVIYIVGKILCSGFAVYFALVAVLGLMSSDKEKNSRRDFKFAALIPARNEATCVENIVASLYGQNYPKELLDVFMIPNNCTDETAELALGAGAHVLEAPGYVKSKGAALDFAILLCKGFGNISGAFFLS